MDVQQLAADVAKFLAPFLPYLIAGGKLAAKKAFEKLGENFSDAAWKQAEELWGKIWSKAKKKEASKEAIEDAAANPTDEDAHVAFRRQLTKLLESDEKLLKFVAEQVNIEGMVNIGGSVQKSTIIAGKNNKVINVTNYIQGNVYNGPPPKNSQDALKVYRAVMVNMTSSLSMRGIDLRASDPNTQKAIGLANVYIDLNTIHAKIIHEKDDPDLILGATFLPLLEAVSQNQSILIKGDPGSGKSTFVNYLTYCLSARTIERLHNWKKRDSDLLPVIVILRDFVRAYKKLPEQVTPRQIWDFIKKTLEDQNLSSVSKPIQELLEEGKVIVFFDGLDEVSTVPQRIFVRDAVQSFANRYPNNRYVVTCRILSYTEPKKKNDPDLRLIGFPEFEIAPFDEEKINSFIDNWYNELTHLRIVSPELASDLNQGLKSAVKRTELRKLAPNPLLLTVMAVVNTHKGRLPDARALLYKETVEILLWQWEQASKGHDAARLRQLLLQANCSDADLEQVICELAYHTHAQTDMNNGDKEMLAGISELNLQEALAAINKGDRNWAASVIDVMKLRAGLLLERDNHVFTFPHRSFEEFLAGTFIESKDDFVSRAKEMADNQILWRQVILWAVSRRIYIRGSSDGPLALVAELCPSRLLNDESEWSKVWLAGDILLEIGLNRVERSELGKELLPRVQNRLVDLLEGGHLVPRERAEAGETLAKLGDPRFDESNWWLPKEPLLGFVHIPAGEFIMGSNALIDAQPQHNIALPDYWIMKYPITVAQFNAFLLESRYEPDDPRSKNGLPNHPVSYTTWHDALEYCEWLNEKMELLAEEKLSTKKLSENEKLFWHGLRDKKLLATLPNEPEWEKAARGIKGLVYPWGNNFMLDAANTKEVGLGATSVVGIFPKGASVYNVFDMIGNIKEWTGSLWGLDQFDPEYKYPYRFDDGRENIKFTPSVYRILRGGDYTSSQDEACCAYRFKQGNLNWAQEFGFRVAIKSFSK